MTRHRGNRGPTIFPISTGFPATRYQGSKARLADWIWGKISNLDFDTALDAFGGTGSVAYRLKQEGKAVTYNDILAFNYHIGRALIANSQVLLTPEDLESILDATRPISSRSFIRDTFRDVYFTDDENQWLDQKMANMASLGNGEKYSLAFYAICQACIVKRPYNLFHRKNLYVRFADVERSFGNKTSWDRPFEAWFRRFVEDANGAVFDNGRTNQALNLDAMDVPGEYDLVYIDTPYISRSGVGVDYLDFYHFLEGLANYDEWEKYIDRESKHLRFKRRNSVWVDKRGIESAFDGLFSRYRDSVLVVSYRSDGIPSVDELCNILSRHKRKVRVESYGLFKYALSTNGKSEEVLLIGE